MKIEGTAEPESPRIKAIVVTDLTDASHGNACGIGLADVTTRRLVDKVNWDVTYANGVTSGFYSHVALPIVASTDEQALEWGIRASHEPTKPKKVVRVRDTLHVSEMYVSAAAMDEIKESVEIIDNPRQLFEEQGSLIAF